MSRSVISSYQFSKAKDPYGDPRFGKSRFTGAKGSKTMAIASGHLPKPPSVHPHNRKAIKRVHRAK